jgi:polyphosphate kinase 2 (PPK2 family)
MNALETQQARLNNIVMRENFQPVAVVLEGRDTAGKSSTIRELTHYLPTPDYSVVLSSKPSAETMREWFRFWENKMPASGICFYDRSWYSRAMVQPLNGWCTDLQYQEFMAGVNDWEAQQKEWWGVRFVKFWLSISEDEQARRISKRETSPLTNWKLSPNDKRALSYYDEMTILKERVLTTTKDWHSIDYNSKAKGRLALITRLCDLLE